MTLSISIDWSSLRQIVAKQVFNFSSKGPEAEVKRWLTNLRVLKNIPFQYIVPTEHALPAESVRFFHIDRNWIDALVDGALSVSLSTTSEKEWILEGDDKTRYQKIMESLNKREALDAGELRYTIRNSLQGNIDAENIAKNTTVGGGLTGMLFRSKIVKDYPGIEISAFNHTSGTNPWDASNSIQVIRMSRLSDSILLCIFNGRPTHLRIQEPSEGIRIGLDTGNNSGEYKLKLKELNGEILGPEINNVPMRNEEQTVIRIEALLSQIKSQLDSQNLTGHENMDSALIATQMLQYPYQQDYISNLPSSEKHPSVKNSGGGS
tara:strand:+ start:1586 stop:2548 length:963 start_codon:yes stop_codon:yes gene_type:complete